MTIAVDLGRKATKPKQTPWTAKESIVVAALSGFLSYLFIRTYECHDVMHNISKPPLNNLATTQHKHNNNN